MIWTIKSKIYLLLFCNIPPDLEPIVVRLVALIDLLLPSEPGVTYAGRGTNLKYLVRDQKLLPRNKLMYNKHKKYNELIRVVFHHIAAGQTQALYKTVEGWSR